MTLATGQSLQPAAGVTTAALAVLASVAAAVAIAEMCSESVADAVVAECAVDAATAGDAGHVEMGVGIAGIAENTGLNNREEVVGPWRVDVRGDAVRASASDAEDKNAS